MFKMFGLLQSIQTIIFLLELIKEHLSQQTMEQVGHKLVIVWKIFLTPIPLQSIQATMFLPQLVVEYLSQQTMGQIGYNSIMN